MIKALEYSIRFGFATGFLGFVFSFVTTESGQMTPLITPESNPDGIVSVARMLTMLGLILGIVVVGIAYRHAQENQIIIQANQQIKIQRKQNWIVRSVTAIASGLLLFVVTSGAIVLLDILAPTYALDRILAITVVTSYAFGVGFAASYWSSRIDAVNLLILAGMAGLTGIIIAALSVNDPLWWQNSLSYLGSTESAGIFFNIGIIITGLLVLAINQETVLILNALVELKRVSRDYFVATRFYLLAIGICIIGVGLFPTRIYPLSDFLHNLSSHLMLVFFVIMMWFTVNREGTFHSPTFIQLSRAIAIFIFGMFVAMMIEVVNFVSFELIIFVPMGIWLVIYQLQVRDFAFSGKAQEVRSPRPQTQLALYSVRISLIALALGAVLSFASIPRVDLTVESTYDDTVETGELAVFTVTVTNAGPDEASGITVRNLNTNGYTFVEATGDGFYDDMRKLWNVRSISVDESATLEIEATLNASEDNPEDFDPELPVFAPVEPENLVLLLADGTGVPSIARMVMFMGLILGLAVTAISYRRFVLEDPNLSEVERTALQGRGFWFSRIVVSITSGLITLAVTAGGVVLFDQLAPDVSFAPSNVVVIVAVYSGLLAFALAYWAGRLDNTNLIILAGITFVLGTILGGLVIGDPDWWTVSLSYLGSTSSPAQGFFNFATLFTGLILLIVNLDSVGLLKVLNTDNQISRDFEMMVKWLLLLIPFGLIGVAVFPRRMNSLYDILHNTMAMGMVGLFMILAFYVVARKDTIFGEAFVRASRFFALLVPILGVIYVLEIVTYVGFELLLMIPIGLWLLYFQHEIRVLARNAPTTERNEK